MTVRALFLYNPGIEVTLNRRVYTVSQLNRAVAVMLKKGFPDIRVEGEVSGLRVYPSGHLYFTLKDDESQIDAVCFRSSAVRLKFELEDGLAVVGHGRLDLYSPRGKYQLVLDSIEPKGVGALQLAFEKLKKKLAAEGLFDEERRKPLPMLPKVIGIVTSTAGAAVHDLLRTLRLRGVGADVLVYPTRVQGEGAAEQIAGGIRVLNERGGVDVIIVGRGGGSIEDLWCFNEEVVARAIAASEVPVVSGVGHEVDFTIADFVADVRAATPTAAAELVARGWEQTRLRLGDARQSLVQGLEQVLLDREQRIERLVHHRAFELVRTRLSEVRLRVQRLVFRAERGTRGRFGDALGRWSRVNERLARHHPIENLLRRRAVLAVLSGRMERTLRTGMQRGSLRLSDTVGRLEPALQQWMNRRRVGMQTGCARLHALSPLASLGRGYSICRKPDGGVVTRVNQVKSEEEVEIQVSDGRIECLVTGSRLERSSTEVNH